MSAGVLDQPAFCLLLACADWPRSDAHNQAIRDAAERLDGDWPAFLTQVRRHRMAPLALDGLARAGIDPPAPLLRRAQKDKRQALGTAIEGRRLLGDLAEAGIDAMMLKGPVLSQYLYGDPAMRQTADLDLLVDYADFANARRLLGERGYDLHGIEPPWGEDRMRLWQIAAKDVTLINKDRRIMVELHHRLKTATGLLPGLSLADASETLEMAGARFRMFGDRDLFTYLVVHEATSLWHRLKWLADLRAMLAVRSEPEIAAMLAHARGLGVGRCAALALLLCHSLWGQPIPPDVLRERDSDRWLAMLEERSLQVLADPDEQMGNFGQTRLTTTVFRLRDDWSYRRSALAAALIDPQIVARFSLPRGLAFLYLPLRMWTWLGRRTSANKA